MDEETERLVKRVRKELRALRSKVDSLENYAEALRAYEEMASALD